MQTRQAQKVTNSVPTTRGRTPNEEGVKSGDLPATADPELLADALVGPILLRRLMMDEPCAVSVMPALVDQVLPIKAPSSPRKR